MNYCLAALYFGMAVLDFFLVISLDSTFSRVCYGVSIPFWLGASYCLASIGDS